MRWEYKVAYVDFRGRVSVEGREIVIEKGERRSAFVREELDKLGSEGWELAGVHPLWPTETSYMIFKRQAQSGPVANNPSEEEAHSPQGQTVDLGREPDC